MIAVGAGLGALLTTFPAFHLALQIAGGAYLLYLAWRIAMTRSIAEGSVERNQPITFLEAAGFQWVNPKAWVMATTAMAIYTNTDSPLLSVLVIASVFTLINLPCVSIWAGFGVSLRQTLSDPAHLKRFNMAMGVVLVLSMWPLLF
ncbi:LysE family translocator [Alkalilimnicola ehrlichii]|uniref:LysE family translocator n=1 Tax=Alkalilimnicola ehrlichii TaxID=351052 RepID=UPI001C6E14A5|nr:LysE family translocator [Alkalilimnicola ehrlichii]